MSARKKPTLSAEALAWLVEYWRMLSLAIVALVLIGIRFETWQGSLARAEAVESDMKALKTDLKADLTLIRQQLFEIARTTGSRVVAAPLAPAPTNGVP